jgi:hypothetical protein
VWRCSEVFNSITVSLFFFPERKIFLEEFNDGLSISEGFLINIIDIFKGFS